MFASELGGTNPLYGKCLMGLTPEGYALTLMEFEEGDLLRGRHQCEDGGVKYIVRRAIPGTILSRFDYSSGMFLGLHNVEKK